MKYQAQIIVQRNPYQCNTDCLWHPAITDFADELFGTVTLTARGALIFNDSASGDPAVCV